MKIVAVCPTVERQDLVRQLVKSIRDSGAPDLPLLVVAMGDEDGTAGWCENQSVVAIRHPEVLPFAKAINMGAKAALEAQPDAEWLLLLNNDLILLPGFWEALAQMDALHYDIAGAKLIYPEGHPHAGQIQHYGKWFTLDWRPFHMLRFQPADHPQSLQIRPFCDVTFACVAIRRVVWDGLGGLCEGYTNGYEDDDFCMAAREAGAQIGVHPGMAAYHWESQTSGLDTANKQGQWVTFKQKWVDTGRIQWATGVFQGWSDV